MQAHRAILRRVGVILIAIGIVDIAFMAYCITNDLNYSSSFNVFSLIAGLFLWFGHLGAARLITSTAALLFSGFLVGAVALKLFLEPYGLRALRFRQDPVGSLLALLVAAAAIGLLYWIYRQLRSEPVLEARRAVGQSVGPPRVAFVIGPLIPLVLLGIMTAERHGEVGTKAIQLARAQVGAGYEFHLQSWSSGGSSGRATVIAFNESEAKRIEVKW
jgi:hypothetical protein